MENARLLVNRGERSTAVSRTAFPAVNANLILSIFASLKLTHPRSLGQGFLLTLGHTWRE